MRGQTVNQSSSLVSESPSKLDNTNHQEDALAEGLAGTGRSKLHNPVLPSEFDLFDPVLAVKHKWDFANRIPFAKVWRGFQSRCGDLER